MANGVRPPPAHPAPETRRSSPAAAGTPGRTSRTPVTALTYRDRRKVVADSG
ncbi:hypothetical protein ACQRET_30545 [Streptomyces koyangensis]|uniref:hypothetical protein n=1 Tax=Streptomyces koyangensis TaxID=188770 RepID=UPI003D08B022